jgi:putative transposase
LPRANRYFLPGNIWHITHRCHKKEFLLKFSKDRRNWLQWLFEAKKRYGLCILNYVVTSNHIHLLVKDIGNREIPRSMQLVAGRVAQAYNIRKERKGAFWEDRYHATAVATDGHLVRCLQYMDLNMVRAGAVQHPMEWQESGYAEMQSPRERYGLTDYPALMHLLGVDSLESMRAERRLWVDEALRSETREKDPRWTETLAVGDRRFVEGVKAALGIQTRNRSIIEDRLGWMLREEESDYGILPPKKRS